MAFKAANTKLQSIFGNDLITKLIELSYKFGKCKNSFGMIGLELGISSKNDSTFNLATGHKVKQALNCFDVFVILA